MNSQTKSAMANILVACFIGIGSGGCVENVSARVNREEAQAKADRPVSTEVELVSIPADPNLPSVVVVVEPFVMAASGVTAGPKTGVPIINPGEQIGPGIAAQLITSLGKAGNVVVFNYDTYQRDPDKIKSRLQVGEQGPFLIKGTITEYSETADTSIKGKSSGYNIWLGMIPWVGPLVSYGHGTKAENEAKHVGMVGLDIQIVDPTTGRLLKSLTAEGSFTSVSATKSRTQLGNTKTSVESASSAIGQAQRMALDKAVIRIHNELVRSSARAER